MSGNNLQITSAIKIMKTLKGISTLRKLYLSDNNITDEVADDIAAVMSCNTEMEVLDVSGNNLQAMGAMKIGEKLRHIYAPKTLFICDNSSIAADDVTAVISDNACLQELYICGNDLQTTDAKAIIKALQDICTLTKIHFGNNNISDKTANDIAAIVYCNTKLKVIEVSGNKLQTTGVINIMKGLQGIYTLEKLYLNNNNITVEAAEYIAAVISCNNHLQELNLGSNYLQTSGIIKITKSLQEISSLITLYINHNNITDKATDDIAAVICCNGHLQELNLGGNNLQTSGIIKITKRLQKISSLTKLYINHNNITHEATDDIAAAISCNTKLQEFDVSGNNLQITSVKKIVRTLKDISTLRKLYLSNSNITDKVADDIVVAISCNTQMEVLDVSGKQSSSNGCDKN